MGGYPVARVGQELVILVEMGLISGPVAAQTRKFTHAQALFELLRSPVPLNFQTSSVVKL